MVGCDFYHYKKIKQSQTPSEPWSIGFTFSL